VEDKFTSGWRSLTVQRAGHEVGAICRDPRTGWRTWWAESTEDLDDAALDRLATEIGLGSPEEATAEQVARVAAAGHRVGEGHRAFSSPPSGEPDGGPSLPTTNTPL